MKGKDRGITVKKRDLSGGAMSIMYNWRMEIGKDGSRRISLNTITQFKISKRRCPVGSWRGLEWEAEGVRGMSLEIITGAWVLRTLQDSRTQRFFTISLQGPRLWRGGKLRETGDRSRAEQKGVGAFGSHFKRVLRDIKK